VKNPPKQTENDSNNFKIVIYFDAKILYT